MSDENNTPLPPSEAASQAPTQGARLQAGSGVRLFVAAPARTLTDAEETGEQEQTRAPEAAASVATHVEDDEHPAESVAPGVRHVGEEGGAWGTDGREVAADEDWIGSLPSRRAADEVASGRSRRKGQRAADARRARVARRAAAARRW
ncbi:MAG: hypothetical protein ACYCYN_06310, partial [Solirubrobacteraceae bacterium]